MTDDLWIVVPNWDRYQHYTDRDPPWIKVHTRVVHDPDFLDLSLADRGLLVTLWVLYARTLGQLSVPRARDFMPARYPPRHFLASLESLNHAGFIHLSASKPLALARARERAREKRRGDKKQSLKRPVENPEDRLAKMIRNGAITDLVHLDAELVDQAIPDDVATRLRAELHDNGG